MSQLVGVEAASACDGDARAGEWQPALRAVVGGQCALFSCFGVVPLTHWGCMWTRDADTEKSVVYGSVAYSVLGLVAMALLGATYCAFVELFPFATLA